MSDDFLTRFHERRKELQEQERGFDLAGERLILRPFVPAEVGRRFVALQAKASRQLIALQDATAHMNGDTDSSGVLALLEQQVTDEEMIQAADEVALSCLDESCHEAWARLRNPDDPNSLTWQELFDVTRYLLGRVGVLPTDAPTDSSGGRTSTETKSKANSSSRATASRK